MRIIHVVPFYYPVIGGVEEVAKRIAEYIASRGYEVYAVTYNRTRIGGVGSLPREETIDGVHVVRLKPDIMWSHGTYSSELPEIFRKLRPDIIHVHAWRHPHVFQIAKLKKKLHFKTVLHGHAPFYKFKQLGMIIWLYHKAVDLFMRNVLKEYDELIALTPYEKNILVKKLDVDEEKVTVVPNGIDDKLVSSVHNIKILEANTVLYLGRISKEKNLNLLIQSMVYVKKEIPDVKLMLAGPDEGLIAELRRYALKHHIDLKYFGPVTEENKYELYSLGSIYANPSLYEGFGLTLLEAQAFGKPCVITGDGGQLYAAPPRKTSLYAKPNPKDFAKAIVTLLTDKTIYKKLSVNARVWASRHLWSKILPLYEKIYGKLYE
ncbi:MAG: glycosyl transferase family 1 [Desulfurococcales archaeon ex4484_217_2]|nr:MAG: glycosyl transferase family 1 [Desulfurococcales archaeon ex4484_217_2]